MSHLVKKSTLVGFLVASALISVPAVAQQGSSASVNQSASTEFPGGVRAATSADAQLSFVGKTKQVSRLRLTQGTAKLTVPAGSELKLEVGSLVVQAKSSELEASFDGAGKPQITCLSGLVGVTDGSGNHFRLSPDSVLSLGADGSTPSVRSRSVAAAQPAPQPVVTPAPAPQAAAPPSVDWNAGDEEEEQPQPRRRNRRAASNEGQYEYQPGRDRDYAPEPRQSSGPNIGGMIMQNLPTILGTVLPFVLNRNQPQYFPGYNQGYYNPGYYPNGGYPMFP
jgi:hypothetical protein